MRSWVCHNWAPCLHIWNRRTFLYDSELHKSAMQRGGFTVFQVVAGYAVLRIFPRLLAAHHSGALAPGWVDKYDIAFVLHSGI